MTREQAKGNLIHAIRWNDMPKKEALEMAIKALEQEPCEDAISRKALISHIENQIREWGEDYDAQQILGDIEDMKPQEPKTGHWIEKMDACECPYCHKAWDYYDNDTEDFDYCPKCGAKLSEIPTGSKDVIWHDKRNYSEIVVEPQESEG